jgi:hypothetical protein
VTDEERRPYPRPYVFELIAVAGFLVIWAVGRGWKVVGTLPESLYLVGGSFALEAVLGVLLRWGLAARRGQGREYLRSIGSAGWLTDTARLIVACALMLHSYSWTKLLVPVLHPRLFDQQLWDLDRTLMFGMSPTIFFLALFRPLLPLFDWAYGNVFPASILIAFAFFLSSPQRRLRAAFVGGNNAMWIIGAWLYVLVPSLGPAYGFPDVWLEYRSVMANSHMFQVLLMKNYQAVLRMSRGANEPLVLIFGVGAFPSLHVAFQTYVFLWFRRVWLYGQIVFGIFAFFILLGSMITGWHYLIDGIAGIVLAAACYRPVAREFRQAKIG